MPDTPEKFSFNLVTEPWIPCERSDGTRVTLNLEETLVQAHELRAIHDDSPLITVTLHRFILAILHHIFGPEDANAWAAIWQDGRGHFDSDMVSQYFRDPDHPARMSRFDLFDPVRPFYQTVEMPFTRRDPDGKEKDYRITAAKLATELAQNATLFHHDMEGNPSPLTPAQATRLLLATQGFSMGGLITYDLKAHKSADASPLVKGAIAIVRGDSLFQTLMLNLTAYSEETEQPFKFRRLDDVPAWDREEPARPRDRIVDGYLDLLTRQSRRIRLSPEKGNNGTTVIRRVVMMMGEQFPDDFNRRKHETMVAFTQNQNASGKQDPFSPVGFNEDRVLWRNSLALFEFTAEVTERPTTLSWLNELVDLGILNSATVYPLDLYGLSSDRAKVMLWRHERLPLPLQLLGNMALLAGLRNALQHAENVNSALRSAVLQYARFTLIRMDAKQPNKQQKDEIKNLAMTFGAEPLYWAALDLEFQQFLRNLARCPKQSDPLIARDQLEMTWCDRLRQTASRVFRETVGRANASAREHKAFVAAERTFYTLLKQNLPNPIASETINHTVPS